MGVADATTPFATPDDLAQRWRALTVAEQQQATVLLGDASQLIRDTCPRWAQATDVTLRSIVCAAVRRVMETGDDPGVAQMTVTTGPFAKTSTFANPSGDLYLTRSEKRRLGVRPKAFSVDTAPNMGVDFHDVEYWL